MKIPWWLILLAFAGYSYWAVNHWHCYKCQCCAAAASPTASSGSPVFKWASAQPEPDSNFINWKKALLAKGGQGDTLLITALYRAAESPDGEKFGLARAAALRAAMAPEMPETRVRLAAKAVSDDWAASGNPRENADFAWLKMVLKKEASAIIESDKDVIFLFPFNSTDRDRNAEVEAYLKNLTEKHKSSTAKFTIVGHTDDVGTPEENAALGLGRANSIAKLFVSGGIAADRIKVESRGETEPAAENTSDEGRQKNRRVVVTVAQ